MKVKEIKPRFIRDLQGLYPEREIKNFVILTLQHVIGFSTTDIVLKKEEEIIDEKLNLIFSILEKLKQEMPIQYILGTTEFYGLSFNVNEDVLIPRQETEELVDWIIKENKNQKSVILDIGTGSGCIAITLKKNFPFSTVYAIDNSEKALIKAKENAIKNDTVIKFLLFDILNLNKENIFPMLDIIVSNPPYVRESEKLQMKNNVLKYEPGEALFVSNDNPLIYYKAIADFSTKYLNKKGILYLEINENLSDELSEMLYSKGFREISIRKDLNNKNRFIRCSYQMLV